MKTKAFAFVLTALLLGIVGTPALLASSASGYRDHGYEEGYRVKQLAREVENATADVYYEARRASRHGGSGLSALYDLHECAEDFANRVRRSRSVLYTYDDFRRLIDVYRDADYAVHHTRNRRVRDGLYRVERLIEALDGEYARASRGYSRHDDRYNRNSRYDNRGYGNGRYDNRRYDDKWRSRRGGRATIVLPRVRIDFPF